MHPHLRVPLDLRRLSRPDLEALAALKLWEEVHVCAREARAALGAASAAWLTVFLEQGAPCIGETPLDERVLARARAYYGPPPRAASPEATLAHVA